MIEAKPLGLMNLKRVQLLPAPKRVTTKSIPQAADLHRSFQTAVKRRKEKIQAAYVQDLKTLQERAKTYGDNQLVRDINRALKAASTP